MQGKYCLRDRHLFDVLCMLDREFESKGIQYSIMAGLAAQLHLAKFYAQNGTIPVNKCDELEIILRTTGDIDVAVQPPDGTHMTAFFNYLAAMYPEFKINNVLNRPRVGDICLNYFDSPASLRGLGTSYQEVLGQSEDVCLKYGNQDITIKVEPLEVLIAEKVSKNRFRPCDEYDLNLVFSMIKQSKRDVDYRRVREVLEKAGRGDRYAIVERFVETPRLLALNHTLRS